MNSELGSKHKIGFRLIRLEISLLLVHKQVQGLGHTLCK